MAGTGALAAPSALADTFCVQAPGCSGTPVGTIKAALDAAAANGGGKDVVMIGAGDYSEAGLAADTGNPVDVRGAGAAQTRIAAPAGDYQTTLALDASSSTLANVSVRTAVGSSEAALRLSGSAEQIEIGGANAGDAGVVLTGGTVRAATIALPGANSIGVSGFTGAVDGSEIVAGTGATGLRALTRSRITADNAYYPGAQPGVTATVDDVVLRVNPGSNGTAISATGLTGDRRVAVRHATMIGGGAGTTGVFASSNGAPGSNSVTVVLRSVIVRGFQTDLSRSASGGPFSGDGKADIDVDYSDYDPSKLASTNTPVSGGGNATGSIADGGHNLNQDPAFLNAGAGDYRLPYSSPVVDRGDPSPFAPGEPGVDLANLERNADGNSDGTAITDMGAFEYQPAAPVVTASAGPASPLVGRPVTFTGTATEPQGEPLVAQGWDFGDGQSAGTPAATHAYAAPGTYTATFTARDASGAAGRATVTVVVRHPRPVISGASLTHAVFTWGRRSTAMSAAARRRRPVPRGTVFRFRLSQGATVRIALARRKAGRRIGRRCVRATPRLVRAHARRCTRYVAAGTLTRRNRRAGANRVAFSGRLRGRPRLRVGRYRARLTASANGRTSAPRTIFFRIVAR